jgi:ABC-type branched-subunit amino acid transport system ATPase component/ABC-type branched-subunit amino acid transport system permease subunit
VTAVGVVTVLGIDFNPQDVFDGAVTGLVYGFLAIGVILLYRASGIVNFAYGAIGSLAAVLVAKMCIDWNWPYVPAFLVGISASALVSCAIEMTVVRRLFDSARITLFVATIGVSQVVTVMVINVPRVDSFGATFPTPFAGRWSMGDNLVLYAPQVAALIVIPLVALSLAWFLNRTIWGIAITATAANPDASRLAGLSPRKMSTLVWVLAGGLAGITTVLAAPLRSTPVSNLAQGSGIQILVIALAVALIARMRSASVAVAVGVVVGIVERVVFYNWANQSGLMEFVLFGVVLVGVVLSRTGAAGGGGGSWSLSARVAPLPDRLRSHLIVRRLPWIPALIALGVAVVIPILIDANAKYFLYTRMALIAIVVISVTILTGWAGQLSLAQFALAGLGAMTMAGADIHLNLQFLPALSLAVGVCIIAAVIMGIPSFRVRGMYLAIVTLAFANAAYAWLFRQRIFNAGNDSSRYEPTHMRIGSLDLSNRRTYYLFCLAALVAVVLMANRLRRSGVGRALVAVRDNEMAAAAFTIGSRSTKLAAFALAGGLAGFAGALLMALFTNARADQFPVDMSLSAVSMAVIGGLASASGAIIGTLWVVGLPAIFGSSPTVGLLTSGVGLLVLIMYFPGGLMQVAYAVRGALVRQVARRMPPAPPRSTTVRMTASPRRGTSDDDNDDDDAGAASVDTPDLVVRNLSVTLGGRRIVDEVDLHIDRDEIVGLIGANGAGKTTIMNAIGGFVPADGTVEFLGRDIGSFPAAQRAQRGIGRSFQDARLFGDLTVMETVALAHERVLPTHMVAVLTGLPTWRRRNSEQLARARDLVDYLGLGGYADHFVGTLSTGTRRICEMAAILALEPRVICLDEPTAGVAQRETEAFAPLISRIQTELGASLLVIEHDMPFVMSISDRVYCLEAGSIIAEGTPDAMRVDPRVVASYLGTDERAIRRSGTGAASPMRPSLTTTTPPSTPTATGSR